ncbi:MAG: Zn-ribbon containing protein [Methanomicrobiales archaeon]|jgi:hypothetical protein|nr:Zn-ribbon containing protein [Methanomicrobiales archaeon]
MPHRCIACGKEVPSSSSEILEGCSGCRGKKFLFFKEGTVPGQVLDPPTLHEPETTGSRDGSSVLPVDRKVGDATPLNRDEEGTCALRQGEEGAMVESVRILAPGSYELNLQKMAESDENIVGIGEGGSYILDLISMVRSSKRKQR